MALPIYGTNLGELLIGTSDDDTIYGLGGNDYVSGEGGNDYLSGDDGADWIDGGAGDDTLIGGFDASDDVLVGGAGIDTAVLSFMNESSGINFTFKNGPIVTSFGTKTLSSIEAVNVGGTFHSDTISGGSYRDGLFGGNGDDMLKGRAGNDLLDGGAGDDWLSGDSGNDFLYGMGGNNTLLGGAGDDRLYSTNDETVGHDAMSGGAGRDMFVVDLEDGPQGNDLILDFRRGQDRIEIESVGEGQPGMLDSFDDLDTNHNGVLDQADAFVMITRETMTIDFTSFYPDRGGTLTLKGISALYASDFFIS